MEKKNMGSFIAVLRKSSGMTQKQLADMLNVSDKTISHWERDESAPDLSLIPVIAEIFGVTCDELLRGERNSDETLPESKITQKGRKQLKFLLEKNFNKLKIKSLFYIAISVVGFICGLIFFYENKAIINTGFLVYSAFNIISLILTVVSYIMYSFSMKTDEIDEKIKSEYIKKGNAVTARTVYFIVVLAAFSVSMLQLSFLAGILYAAGALAACIVIDIILKSLGVIYKKERNEKEKRVYKFNVITFAAMVAVLACTGAFQYYSMIYTAELGDIMSMLRYVIYPIEVIIFFIVYAIGNKIIKKPRN